MAVICGKIWGFLLDGLFPLEADDSLAMEAAVATFLAHLADVVRLNNGANARSDRAIREHARNLGQSLRRGQWIRE
ncbi:MAG TPA: hypothetical protein VJ305_08925 [Streptosporangiaceae bacterium]|nr:hypothetical protein [Streptosporangiaceae bacterium]